ncbi:MAG: tRNA dihydrouridine synthase DusB [Proteobacteria bacterium]|nr:tRNA dihydrouridine synthase DusB [Pseudomonadota bacterium]
MLAIGPYSHSSRVVVAPMAGVTDKPFRDLCRGFGAHWAVSEMVTSDQRLWHTDKSRLRLGHRQEGGVSWVQLAGAEPAMMADAARANAELGAQIIDINMGCPAKKVCNRAAGSALLRDEKLVADILEAVVSAVEVPVTLKIRLGWSPDEKNGARIAGIAEASGISLLTVHGRTRACRFTGSADYEGIRQVRQATSLPLLANGDIDSPATAARVLSLTGADGVMVGRAAQGRPWLPGQIDQFLETGVLAPDPDASAVIAMLYEHVQALHQYYGEFKGVRIARKHIGWTLDAWADARSLKSRFNTLEQPAAQLEFIRHLEGSRYAA